MPWKFESPLKPLATRGLVWGGEYPHFIPTWTSRIQMRVLYVHAHPHSQH